MEEREEMIETHFQKELQELKEELLKDGGSRGRSDP